MKKLLALVVALVLIMSPATVASAAEYPSKGTSVICPWIAGGYTIAHLNSADFNAYPQNSLIPPAIILGPMCEKNFVRFMTIKQGNFFAITQSPISMVFLIVAVGTVVFSIENQSKINKREAASKAAQQ